MSSAASDAFDLDVATGIHTPGLDGEPRESAPLPGAHSNAVEFFEQAALEAEVGLAFLEALGLPAAVPAATLLDFDPEDLAATRKELRYGDLGAATTPLQRAALNRWMRLIYAAVTQPTGRGLSPAPDRPRTATAVQEQSRSSHQPAPLSARAPPSLPVRVPEEPQWIPTESSQPGSLPAAPLLPSVAKSAGPAPLDFQAPPTVPPAWFAAAAAAIGTATLAAASSQKSARQLKDVLDQSDPGTYVPLSKAELAQARALYLRRTGVVADGDVEPSAEQLGALRTRLASGGAPHVDFSVWGPHDRRHAKDHRHMALVPTAEGLQPRLLKGPPHFEAWDQAWSVFTAAMVSLGAATVGALGRYRKGIRSLTLLYPTLWGVVSRADEAMRFEQWPRMSAEEDPSGDWSDIISASAWGEHGTRQFFWKTHVEHPADHPQPHTVVDALESYTPRGASVMLGAASAGAGRAAAGLAAPAAPVLPPWKKSRRGGRQRENQVPATPPPAVPPAFAAAPAAPPAKKAVCFNWNAGRCVDSTTCTKGFVHRCVVCNEVHRGSTTAPCSDRVDKMGRLIPAGKGKAK